MAPRRAPIRAASPIVRALFEHAEARNVPISGIACSIGALPQTVRGWRMGRNEPHVMSVEALADTLGLELSLVPKGGSDEGKVSVDSVRAKECPVAERGYYDCA